MVGYGEGMIETAASSPDPGSVEEILREGLAEGDAMAERAVPILRHLLGNDENSLFSDEVIARVRGMLAHVSSQLLDAMEQERSSDDASRHAEEDVQALSGSLGDAPAVLGHVHALALEWQLTERLHARHGLDTVLSPLVQELVASKDAGTAALAMKVLAAQARYCQSQRRMQLPLGELPGDLLHQALIAMRTLAGGNGDANERAAAAEATIRAAYDEGASRLALLSRLVASMGGTAVAALSVTHAGVALFATALSIGSGQDRDAAILSTNEAQLARFALSLRAAGLKPMGVEEQFLAIHPEIALPEGFEQLGADRAAAILSLDGFRGG